MSYIFGKLWHLAIIWAIRKAFQCIQQGVRFLLAKQTQLSGTFDNESYARRYDGQIVQGFRSASFKVCLVLILLNTIVEQTYHEPWNYYFVSISWSKSPVKSSQNLQHKFLGWKWPPSPPWNFRFGSVTRLLGSVTILSHTRVCVIWENIYLDRQAIKEWCRIASEKSYTSCVGRTVALECVDIFQGGHCWSLQCGHCWMTSILLLSTRWQEIKPPLLATTGPVYHTQQLWRQSLISRW